MEAGGVCLQKRRRRRRKRSETPAETVSKGWGGPSPPPGHGERPAGRDGMCCGAGGGAGGVNHGAGSRPTGREEPSPAEPSPASRCGCPAPRRRIAPFLQPASTAGLRAAPARSPGLGGRRGPGTSGAVRAQVPPAASPERDKTPQPLAIKAPKHPPAFEQFPSPKKAEKTENNRRGGRRALALSGVRARSVGNTCTWAGGRCPPAAGEGRLGSLPCPGERQALLTTRHRPLGAPRRPPGPSSASAPGEAARPPRGTRPSPAPVPVPVPAPMPVPPGG